MSNFEIKKIYFDMDGVLADFDRGVLELCGITLSSQSERTEEDDEAMWEGMRGVDHFYGKLKPIEGVVELFNELYSIYGDKCEILSAVPKPSRNMPQSREDKLDWVKRYLPEGVKVNLVYRAEKQDFAMDKGCVLVDDYGINIDEWAEAGGTGVLFEDAVSTLEKIRRLTDEKL